MTDPTTKPTPEGIRRRIRMRFADHGEAVRLVLAHCKTLADENVMFWTAEVKGSEAGGSRVVIELLYRPSFAITAASRADLFNHRRFVRAWPLTIKPLPEPLQSKVTCTRRWMRAAERIGCEVLHRVELTERARIEVSRSGRKK